MLAKPSYYDGGEKSLSWEGLPDSANAIPEAVPEERRYTFGQAKGRKA